MQLKNIGIFALLVAIVAIATIYNGNFVAPANLKTLIRDTSLYGLISIGVAMVIITGGIDLSIGSMIALCGVMLVQVINVHYDSTDFKSKIAEVRSQASGELTFPAFRLSDPPPGMRDGDRLTYRSTTGTSAINVHSVLKVDGQTWVQTRDNLRTLRAGTEVGLETIEYTPPLIACSMVLHFRCPSRAVAWRSDHASQFATLRRDSVRIADLSRFGESLDRGRSGRSTERTVGLQDRR